MSSQHPADLKPRGVKAPMYLIPWSAVPHVFRPSCLHQAAYSAGVWADGDPYAAGADEPASFLLGLTIATVLEAGLEDVARVFAYGAAKYARDNWRTFAWDDRARDEYYGAICRHLDADRRGERIDPESRLPHVAHAACGCLIWRWHENRIAASKNEERADV
jgi:hypothetical protein